MNKYSKDMKFIEVYKQPVKMFDNLVSEAKSVAYQQAVNVVLEEALKSGYTDVLKRIESKIEKLIAGESK